MTTKDQIWEICWGDGITLMMVVMHDLKIKLRKQFHYKTIKRITLGINLTKETKYLYAENYKTLMKGIKEDLNKWKDLSFSWIRRLNIINTTILPKAIYGLNAISFKIPVFLK